MPFHSWSPSGGLIKREGARAPGFVFFSIALLAAVLRAQGSDGVIAGTVRDSSTNLPVASVDVSLNGSAAQATAQTDADGGFRFTGLPSGIFWLAFTRAGYEEIPFGSGNARESIVLKSGGEAQKVLVSLIPYSDIEGVVKDERGLPVEGVEVHAGGGLKAVTDKAGLYRLEELPPGSYRIAFRLPYGFALRSLQHRENGDEIGYSSTLFYPGVWNPLRALAVSMPPGKHLSGLDVRLSRTRLVELKGHILEPGGEGGVVRFVSLDWNSEPAPPDQGLRPVDEHGGFHFEHLVPGSYKLFVWRSKGDGLPYVVPVELGDAGIESLSVNVPAFVQLQGFVKASPYANWDGSLRVRLLDRTPEYPGPRHWTAPALIGQDGSLDLDKVPPGEWYLEVYSTGLHSTAEPSRKLYVSAVSFGDQASSGVFAMRVQEGGNPPIRVTLTDQSGEITGAVSSDGQRPVYFAVITLRKLGIAPGYLPGGRSELDGTFHFDGVAPGEYELAAWGPGSDGHLNVNTSQDNGCGSRNVKITVKNGGTSAVRLTLCHE